MTGFGASLHVWSHALAPLDDDQLILETDRLVLRPLRVDDTDLAVAMFTDPDVVRYVCDVMTPEAIIAHLPTEARRGAGGRIGIWVAARKDTCEQIGTGVLLPLPLDQEDTDWSLIVEDGYPDAEIEIGYMLLPDAWGQGFATEICRRLLRFWYDFTDLAEIKATVEPENLASRRVLLKSGLKEEGMRRAYGTQCPGFGLTREEYRALLTSRS